MTYDHEADHEEVMQRFASIDHTLSAIQSELDDIQAQMDVMLEMAQTIIDKLEESET